MDQKTTSEIIDVDGYVHVICGKVICFTKAIYISPLRALEENLETEENAKNNDLDFDLW